MTETKAIDTHTHLWNEDYLDKLGKLGSQGTEVAKGINQSASKEDLEKRFKMMDDAGVDLQIISATPQSHNGVLKKKLTKVLKKLMTYMKD